MSQANVDLVRGLLDGAVEMDKQAILAALPELVAQAFTEDAEWIEDPQRADRQVWRGHDGICESWRRWLDQWDEYGFDVTAIEDHGENVFVAAREEDRGSASGAAVAADNYIVVSFREGKIARYPGVLRRSAGTRGAWRSRATNRLIAQLRYCSPHPAASPNGAKAKRRTSHCLRRRPLSSPLPRAKAGLSLLAPVGAIPIGRLAIAPPRPARTKAIAQADRIS